jgi:hypothetical protein
VGRAADIPIVETDDVKASARQAREEQVTPPAEIEAETRDEENKRIGMAAGLFEAELDFR